MSKQINIRMIMFHCSVLQVEELTCTMIKIKKCLATKYMAGGGGKLGVSPHLARLIVH